MYPQTAQCDDPNPVVAVGLNGTYANDAPIYLARGWHPIPLPPGQKAPPPTGYTGKCAIPVTYELVGVWCAEKPNHNPAVALHDEQPYSVLAIDCDNYANGSHAAGTAEATLAGKADSAGCPWPPTYYLAHRDDGSRKLFYRVPGGLAWVSDIGPGVQVIRPGHRYANAGVNPRTGKCERWYGPNGAALDLPPYVDQLPLLPAELQAIVGQGSARPATPLAPPEIADAFWEALPNGDIDPVMQADLDTALDALDSAEAGCRHDAVLALQKMLLRAAEGGAEGIDPAMRRLREGYVGAVAADRDGGAWEAGNDFDRMLGDNVAWMAGAEAEAKPHGVHRRVAPRVWRRVAPRIKAGGLR